jgi:hypothetical protein
MPTRVSPRPETSKAGMSPKFRQYLENLSRKPPPPKRALGSLAAWEERNEGWIDRADARCPAPRTPTSLASDRALARRR